MSETREVSVATETAFYSAKGGVGCSTVVALYALQLDGDVLVFDLSPAQDLHAVFGFAGYDDDGIAGEHVTPRGRVVVANKDTRQFQRFDAFDHVVYDWGTSTTAGLNAIPRRHLVTRACYLAVRAAVKRLDGDTPRPDSIVLVLETHRALGVSDLEGALGAPVGAVVEYRPEIARMVDAGLLVLRGSTGSLPGIQFGSLLSEVKS